MVFVDECLIKYVPFLTRKRMFVKEGEELVEKHLKPSFKSRRTIVSVFACTVLTGISENHTKRLK